MARSTGRGRMLSSSAKTAVLTTLFGFRPDLALNSEGELAAITARAATGRSPTTGSSSGAPPVS